MPFIDTIKSLKLAANPLWRASLRRFRSSRLYTWRLTGPVPGALATSLVDLRPTDPTLANDYYAGRFTFDDQNVETSGASPFTCQPPGRDWQDALHGFRWLRHMSAADTELARAQGAVLILDWIAIWGSAYSSRCWQADRIATRLIAWCAHAPRLLAQATEQQQVTLRRSMARQARHLAALQPTLDAGWPRLHAAIALAHFSFSLRKNGKAFATAMRDLDRELDRHVLSDGGAASRNPADLLLALTDLLPLQTAFIEIGEPASRTLVATIDRMREALRFFQHSNGELAQFNGTGSTPHLLLALLLGEDLKRNVPQKSAPQTGYERLSTGKTTILMDTGKPPKNALAAKALAGCLSFELSSGRNLFIANCGVPDRNFEAYAPFVRASAAQSTAVISDTSSCHFAAKSALTRLMPSPLLRGPRNVTCERRHVDDVSEINASHDGYVEQFSLVHRRILQLSDDGTTLNGADRFEPVGKSQQVGDGEPVTVRFHLPPDITASHLANGHSILLAAPNREAWTFTCIDAPISIEESMRFTGPDHPRKSTQIVVSGMSARHQEIRWVMVRRAKKSARKSDAQESLPDLLDLLEPRGRE